MKNKLLIILLAVCLLTGCMGVDNSEVDNTDPTQKIQTEEVKQAEMTQTEKIQLSAEMFVKDNCRQFEETDIEFNNDTIQKEMDYSDASEAKDISNDKISKIEKMPYDAGNEYKKGKTPEQLEKNLKQEAFVGECEKVENIVSKEGRIQKKEAIFEAGYADTVVYNDNEGIYENIDELIEDKENDSSIYKCNFGLYDIKEDMVYARKTANITMKSHHL